MGYPGDGSLAGPPSGTEAPLHSFCIGLRPHFLWLPRRLTLAREFLCAAPDPDKEKAPAANWGALKVPARRGSNRPEGLRNAAALHQFRPNPELFRRLSHA